MRIASRVLRTVPFSLACLLILLGPLTALAQSGPLPPAHLKCEYLSNPMGIDVSQPRFAWVLEHTGRNEGQTAYQVLVAATREGLEHDRGSEWDSGKVASDQSTQVVYEGKALKSGHRYYWEVRYWDKEGNASTYSRPAWFEMGLLERSDWKGQWIGGFGLMRKEFTLPGRVVRARAYVTALGYYELHLNGKKVGHRVLDPAWTVYSKRVLYSTYDVTPLLKQGANAVGAMLGGGWATEPVEKPYYSQPAFLLHLDIELQGGREVTVVSDRSWQGKQGPVLKDSVYNGEVYDARREVPGWDQPGLKDTGWKPVEVTPGTQGTLSAEMMPPIRVVDTLVPKSVSNPKPGVYVFDFGQNFAGWAELHVSGPRGTAVKMRFSELVYPDGMINRENLEKAKARDIYILRGGRKEVYQPHFTYHGFRYVELTGFPGTPSLDTLRARVVHSGVATTGSFVASKEILNQIQHLIHWGQLSNLMSIPTDCDQRNERQGWMGDAQVTGEEAMLNFGMAAFYTNFIRDIHDAQHPDGSVPDTVPHKYGRYPADPAWGTAYPLLCWYMYEQYGDRRILTENYDGLKKYVEFLRSRAQDNVLRYSYYGDWVAIEPTPGALVSDSYYYYDVQLLAKIARILGKDADAQTYSQLAAQIKGAFNHTFLNADGKQYANGTQTANTMPLFLDLVPHDHQSDVMSSLVRNIIYTHNTHVTTGFIGIKYLLPVLTSHGQSDLAYELATQTTYPSWGYMIAKGATTLWELWQDKTGPGMNSHNHAMFGSVGAWFYQALGGINEDPDAPGYKHILFQPQIVRDLTSVSATINTLHGPVSCSWTHAPEVITVNVKVPVGSTATVVIPKERQMTEIEIHEGDHVVWQDGRFVEGDPGVAGASQSKDKNKFTFKVGSGAYSFKLTGD